MTLDKTNIIVQLVLLVTLNAQLAGMETPHSAHAIVANPVEYLKKIHTTNNTFSTDIKKIAFNLATLKEEYPAFAQKYELLCPLFLLNECTQAEIDSPFKGIPNCYVVGMKYPCALSRIKKPSIRASFEQQASQLLINKLLTNDIVTYTGFACGDAFQDLMIITKALISQPKARLNIHLIDGSNTPYVCAVDYFNHSREIKADETYFNFGSRLPEYEEYARNREKRDPGIQTMSREALQKQLALLCVEKETQYKQFIKWLTHEFPESKISLYIHDIVQNYCNFLEKNHLAHADIVTTTDIDDVGAIEQASIHQYAALCKATLNAKPTASNAWLIRTHDYAAISTARLPETKDATKIWFDYEDL